MLPSLLKSVSLTSCPLKSSPLKTGPNCPPMAHFLGRQSAPHVVVSGLALCLTLFDLPAASATPLSCAAHSSPVVPPVIELFTSEGCSSCPPADRWAAHVADAPGLQDAILLAQHVDYWDDLGWPDPYAQADFSLRQRGYAEARRTRGVYTPQVMVGADELGDWGNPASLGGLLARQRARSSAVQLRVRVEARTADAVTVSLQTSLAVGATDGGRQEDPLAAATVALLLTEDGLQQRPPAGENRGQALQHDGVVRAHERRPATRGTTTWVLPRAPAQDWQHSHLVALVQAGDFGAVLQAVSLPLGADCPLAGRR